MIFLNEGDKTEIKGSGKKPYEIKKVGGVVSCSCPAWRNLGGPIDIRVCKHIKANIDPDCLLPQAKSLDDKDEVPVLIKDAKTPPPCLLAHKWENEDPTGWWMSEKLDGVRAWWDGKKFISRLGNVYHAPESFLKHMPSIILDGELFAGRRKFQETVSTVRKLIPDETEWGKIKYLVFDAPYAHGSFEERYEFLKILLRDSVDIFTLVKYKLVPHIKCINLEHMKQFLKEIQENGGEGVMLREPGSFYIEGRSKTLLKVKSFFDDEAIVVEHIAGKGKHKGRLGAIEVNWNGIKFSLGTGFSDAQRENPPPIGSRVTFRFQEKTRDGVPRFPVFLSERID